MPPSTPPTVSNSAADRAGARYRESISYLRTPIAERDPASEGDMVVGLFDALDTISAYRRMHAKPMDKVTLGIASMVRTVRRNDEIRPGQRFKRMDRITDKLFRYPRMRLSQMEDIGGCRVILPSLDEAYAVLGRVRHNWPDAMVGDYIDSPKADGYRGIHVVQKRDGRLIEVQIRTVGQHEWAEAVEVFGPRTGYNLKDGAGPADLREYFKLAAERIARQEQGDPPDEAAEEAFATLRQRVLPYFQRNA